MDAYKLISVVRETTLEGIVERVNVVLYELCTFFKLLSLVIICNVVVIVVLTLSTALTANIHKETKRKWVDKKNTLDSYLECYISLY